MRVKDSMSTIYSRLVGFHRNAAPGKNLWSLANITNLGAHRDTQSLGRHVVSEPVNTVDTLHATACRR